MAVSNCIKCSYTEESGESEFQNEMAISIAKGETCQGRRGSRCAHAGGRGGSPSVQNETVPIKMKPS